MAGAAWPYTVDDAFIVARYARNLAAGAGYVMNVGDAPSDAVTGPLWLVPGVLAALVGVDPVAAAKIAGAACTLLAVWITVARVRGRSGGTAASVAAAAMLVTSPSLGTWSVAGLETGAATLALVLALDAVTRRPAPHALRAGVAVGALAWLRPELVLACAVLLVGLALRDRRRALAALVPASLGALGVVGARLVAFGEALPLAVLAKPGTLANGLDAATRGVVLATSGFGLVLCAYAVVLGRRDDRLRAAVLGAQALAVVLAGGDWMPGARLFVPVLPVYAALAGVGATRLLALRQGRRIAPVLVALACVVPAVDLVVRIPELRSAGRSRDVAGEELAAWLGANARRVALVDVGHLAYASGCEVVDLGGLTDPVVARLPGGHLTKRVEEAWLRERAPDAIVLHSSTPPVIGEDGRLLAFDGFPVERRVAAMRWVREELSVARVVRYAPSYHYFVLKR